MGPRRAAIRWSRMAVRTARRVVIAVVGGTLLLVGLVMTVLPGPALVMIPLALAVLAVEFTWARRFLDRVRSEVASRVGGGSGDDRASPAGDAGAGSGTRSASETEAEIQAPTESERDPGAGPHSAPRGVGPEPGAAPDEAQRDSDRSAGSSTTPHTGR